MYDGINSDASYIHAHYGSGAELVAGYVGGSYVWTQADWNLFPNAVHVYITPTASHTGKGVDVLDVETGDATAAQTEGWIKAQKAAGYARPTIYTSLSNVAAVRAGTGAYVLGQDYDLWVADYDNSTASPYAGCAAKQYKNEANDDMSVVYDAGWPHRSGSTPPAKPAIPGHGATKNITATSAVATYTGVAGGVKYMIQVCEGATASGKLAFQTTVGGSSGSGVSITGLTAGTKYGWRIMAYNSAGQNSGWSGFIGFTTSKPVPGIPSGYKYSETATSVTVSWTGAAGATGYDCQLVTSDEKTQAGRQTVTADTVTFSGLSASTEYKFRIASQPGGAWSGYVTMTTADNPDTYPKPGNLKATGWLGYEISWSPVALNGVNAPSYTVQVMDVNGKQFEEFTATATTYMIRVPKGTYTANVWGDSAPVGPPHSSLKFTI